MSFPNWESAVAITIFCASPDFFEAIMLGSTVKPNIIAGSRIVITMNDFLRTVSRYSRRANRKMLCISLPHYVDKDVFQRRFDQLKLIHSRVLRNRVQQFLGICARTETHFHVISVVVERLNQAVGAQKFVRTFVLDLYIAASVTTLDLFQRSLQHGFAAIYQANRAAKLLHLIHAVSRKKDRASLFIEVK